MKLLLIVRHGEKENTSESNHEIRKQLQLTEYGQSQAFATGQYLKGHYPNVKAVYTSDFPRCLQTARVIKRQLGVKLALQINPLLGEHCFTSDTISLEEKKTLIQNSLIDASFKSESGESMSDSAQRFCTAIENIAELMREDEVIIVVTHARIFQNYLAIYHGMVDEMLTDEVAIKPCSVSILEKDQTVRVDMLNNNSHIPSNHYKHAKISI